MKMDGWMEHFSLIHSIFSGYNLIKFQVVIKQNFSITSRCAAVQMLSKVRVEVQFRIIRFSSHSVKYLSGTKSVCVWILYNVT